MSLTPTDRSRRLLAFETSDPAGIRRLLAEPPREAQPGVRPGPSVRLRETHLDTQDGRFLRAGYCLAIRDDGHRREVVLSPCRSGGTRPVLRVKAPCPHATPDNVPAACPEPLRGTVRAVVGRALLRETSRRLVRKETWQLIREDERAGSITIIETLDHENGNHESVQRARVELEVEGRESDEGGLVSLLHSRFDLTAAPDDCGPPSLSRKAAARAAKLGSTKTGAKRTAGETAFAVLRKHFARCIAREPGTRLGADPEELHDMRVAVRRVRGALRLFRRHLPKRSRRFSAELRWLGRALAQVRDLDVEIDWLGSHAEKLPSRERRHIRDVEAALKIRRAAARRAMLEALDSDRYEQLVEDLAACLRRGPGRQPRRSRRSILRVAPGLIEQRMRALVRTGRAIRGDSKASTYHRVRILAKRARYALEFHADLYGEPAAETIRRLVRLQDLLGEHQDAVVFLDRVTRLVEDDGQRFGPDTVRALELLQRTRIERARELCRGFPDAFDAVRGKPWKRLRRRLRRRAS